MISVMQHTDRFQRMLEGKSHFMQVDIGNDIDQFGTEVSRIVDIALFQRVQNLFGPAVEKFRKIGWQDVAPELVTENGGLLCGCVIVAHGAFGADVSSGKAHLLPDFRKNADDAKKQFYDMQQSAEDSRQSASVAESVPVCVVEDSEPLKNEHTMSPYCIGLGRGFFLGLTIYIYLSIIAKAVGKLFKKYRNRKNSERS